MKCSSIMTTPPTHVYVDTSVRDTMKVLKRHHMYNLPVIDRNGVFAGEISSRRLVGLLLPSSMTMELGLTNVRFMRESPDELMERYQRVCGTPVSDYMATDIEVVHPDSPVIEALALLYQKYIRIAVVERDTRRLVGGISFITVLRELEKLEARLGTADA
jgi:CBS domain-containing protein